MTGKSVLDAVSESSSDGGYSVSGMPARTAVITQLMGGLGNQMFQYAVARCIANAHNLEVKVDPSILLDHSPGRHQVNRNYDLDIFTLRVSVATRRERRWFNAHGLTLCERLLCRLRRAVGGHGVYREKSFRFEPSLLAQPVPPRYLVGLWQSYKYFEHDEEIIRNDFHFRQRLPEVSAQLAAAMEQVNSVCINVRRTDYISVPGTASTMGFVGVEYYRDAAAAILSRLRSDARFFVFSDDVDWCKRELRWLPNDPVFVDHEHAGPKFSHYLQLMTRARHFVIPNSTFAWWGAWLSRNPRKVVVAPKRWFRDPAIDTSDLCPPDWCRS